MSFALPTTITVVDKYPGCAPSNQRFERSANLRTHPTIWQILGKYALVRELVQIACLNDILDDPQTKVTMFIPIDFLVSKTTLKSCIGNLIGSKEIASPEFETARTIVDSLIIPSVVSTTMMIQSAFTRYRTRHLVNTLTVETAHCVQFEPYTYNKPPFGISLNGKSRVLTPDIVASNGIVHTVDTFPYSLGSGEPKGMMPFSRGKGYSV